MMEFSEVRARVGGLKGVIEKLGDAPPEHKWKSFPQCPFCGHKDSAGIWTENGAEFFKCHYSSCNTGGRVVTEVGYLGVRLGLSEDKPAGGGPSPAYQKLLEMAGVWAEPTPKASMPQITKPQPGTEPRPGNDGPLPNPVPGQGSVPEPSEPSDEDLLRAAIEAIRTEGRASASMLKQRLRLGFIKADQILNELELRGVLGPAQEKRSRAILNLDLPASAKAAAGGPAAGSDFPLPPAPGAIAPAEPQPGHFTARVVEGMDVGVKGQGGGDSGAAVGPTASSEVAPSSGPAVKAGVPAASESPPAGAEPRPGASSPPAAPAAAGSKGELEPGQAGMRWFFERLEPTWEQQVPYLPASAKAMEGGPDELPIPEPLPSALVRKLQYRPVSLMDKRGLSRITCELLGFRANRRENEQLLMEMPKHFDWDERLASGLWKEASVEHHLDRRPDPQFYGKGQVGKKPEDERQDEDDKWQWGWCEPPLIPYFDEFGALVKLRPHKGGARRDTAAGSDRIYVPRAYRYCGDLPPEKFSTVIICEGEFKAAVIWRAIGGGAALLDGYQTPVGVCALPGISFARNEDYREDLEEWLRAVGCLVVKVAFDDEDKSHKPLRQRFDSVIYAQYLAIDLAKKLHICGKYCPLPKAWRNARGKADWDGAAAMMYAEFKQTWKGT